MSQKKFMICKFVTKPEHARRECYYVLFSYMRLIFVEYSISDFPICGAFHLSISAGKIFNSGSFAINVPCLIVSFDVLKRLSRQIFVLF
jgi:hypothetical protein